MCLCMFMFVGVYVCVCACLCKNFYILIGIQSNNEIPIRKRKKLEKEE